MRSARPPYAPTGKPPPRILPRQVRSGRIPYISEKARAGRPAPHVRGDRLDRDDRDALPMRSKKGRDRLQVVVPRRQREAGERAGDAGRAGDAERRKARAGGDEERVGVPVITPRELQDELAARRAGTGR